MRLLSRSLYKLSSSKNSAFMGSKQLFKFTSSNPLTHSSHRQLSNTCRILFSVFPPKRSSGIRPFCLETNGYHSISYTNAPRSPGMTLVRTRFNFSMNLECSYAPIYYPEYSSLFQHFFIYFEFIRWPGRTEAKWVFLCTYWCFYLKDLVNFISNCSVALLEDSEEKGYISNMRMMRQKLEKLDMDIEICTPGQYNHLLCPMVDRYFPSAPTFSLLFCFYSLLVVVFDFV